jgi:hypothetical protein
MTPYTHRGVTEHDPLAIDSNLGQLISSAEFGCQAAKCAVVIPFNHVDIAADNPIPITPRLIGPAHAEIPEKVQDVILANQAVQVPKDRLVHLAGRVKRPAAIANDVLVPEMKVSSKPRIDH